MTKNPKIDIKSKGCSEKRDSKLHQKMEAGIGSGKGRIQVDLKIDVEQTDKKIKEFRQAIAKMDPIKQKKKIKDEKNKISAYKSRIAKRLEVEELKSTIDKLH